MADDSERESGGFISFLPMKPDVAAPAARLRQAGAGRLPPEALGRFSPPARAARPVQARHAAAATGPGGAPGAPAVRTATGGAPGPSSGRSTHQDAWLDARRHAGEALELQFLDGTLLRGRLAHFDTYALVFETAEGSILVYKHAVSRIRPVTVTP